jgi:hypothetical protein
MAHRAPKATLPPKPLHRRWTGAPRSPRRTWAENEGRSPTNAFVPSSNGILMAHRALKEHISAQTTAQAMYECPWFAKAPGVDRLTTNSSNAFALSAGIVIWAAVFAHLARSIGRAAPIFFGPCTPRRTWGARPEPLGVVGPPSRGVEKSQRRAG